MLAAVLSGSFALLTAVTTAQAETAEAPPPSPPAVTRSVPQLADPSVYPPARLFRPERRTARLQSTEPPAPWTSTAEPNPANVEIICGLRVWRVDARQDPRILLPQQQTAVDAKIRKIAPTVCRNPVADDALKK